MSAKIKSKDIQIWDDMKQYLCIPEFIVQSALQNFALSKEKSLEKKAETFFKSYLADIGIQSKKMPESDKKILNVLELMLVSRALIEEIMTSNKPEVSRDQIIEAQGNWTARECLELLGRASNDGTTRTWQNWIAISNEKRRLNPEEFSLFKFKKIQLQIAEKLGELHG